MFDKVDYRVDVVKKIKERHYVKVADILET